MGHRFGDFFTPRDMTVITTVLLKAAHHERDWNRRAELIGILTKLQRSKRRRRSQRTADSRSDTATLSHPHRADLSRLSAEQDGGR